MRRTGLTQFVSPGNATKKNEGVRRLAALHALLLFWFAQVATAQTFSVLHAFTGPPDGAGPTTLIRDHAGNLYGSTAGGGAVTNSLYCDPYGCGTVFAMNPARKESVLYAFAPIGIENGDQPWGTSLARDGAGNLYGTTLYGGNIGCFQNSGCGPVFKVTPSGRQTVIYRFTGMNGDGVLPAGLTGDAAGNLYGTTQSGGDFNQGTVFKIDSSGNEIVVHSFKGYPSDGSGPVVGVVLDPDGNIYGTTFFGGTYGSGSIFKVTGTGEESLLYSFGPTLAVGFENEGSLLRDSAGNLYGTTVEGGDLNCNGGGGCGVVYKLDPSGTYSVLYGFTGAADGAYPQTGLGIDTGGNLYGTTSTGGGTKTCGTVFKLSLGGVLTLLHAFTGCGENGVLPTTAPLVDAAGNVYGTTGAGGTISSECPHGCGVVFKITP
ncbi:MAG TPA: choice-of-anchor tandem repeat GloVer-containing protein [Candidatus Sulfotelmatobacter sp.]